MSYFYIMWVDNEINIGICEYMNIVYVIFKM